MLKFILLALLIVILAFVICGLFTRRLRTTHYDLHSKKIKGKISAVFISDFHNCGNIKRIVSFVDEYSPDLVLFGGDLADRISQDKRALQLAKILSKKYKCFFAPGNHEYHLESPENFFVSLKNMGVTVLEEQICTVKVNGNRIQICGVYDGEKLSSYCDRTQLETVSDNSNRELYRILLAHFPMYVKSYLRRGFDLILSGHEHGGIVGIPKGNKGENRGLFGHSGFFPKFSGGEYSSHHCTMIVSRGVSSMPYNLIIPRFFNRPELVTLTIKGIEKNG
ncbi:MAG: metallophosphoesterase [Ruminococcus sp.]